MALPIRRPWRTGLQRRRILLETLVIVAADFSQEGKLFRCDGEFCQRLNGLEAGKLCDMDLVRAKWDGRLVHKCPAWQEIDRAASPGLTRPCRLAS